MIFSNNPYFNYGSFMILYIVAVIAFLTIRFHQLEEVQYDRDEIEIKKSDGRWLSHSNTIEIKDIENEILYSRSIKKYGLNTYINPFEDIQTVKTISFYRLKKVLDEEYTFFGYNGKKGWRLKYDYLSYYLGDSIWVFIFAALGAFLLFDKELSGERNPPVKRKRMNLLGLALLLIIITFQVFI